MLFIVTNIKNSYYIEGKKTVIVTEKDTNLSKRYVKKYLAMCWERGFHITYNAIMLINNNF